MTDTMPTAAMVLVETVPGDEPWSGSAPAVAELLAG
jgi:hypothetical protein